MKRGLGIAMVILLLASLAGAAETHYVNTEVVEITFRSGPGLDRKIITMLKASQTVTVVREGGEWSLARLPDGREGWVLARFLTTEPPSQIRLQKLEQQHQNLKTKLDQISQENAQLKTENEELTATLAQTRQDLEGLNGQYETLKSESAEFLDIKAKYTQMSKELSEHTTKSATIQKELDSLKLNQSVKWFIAGGGMLLLGWAIGFFSKRKKRRSSLY